MKSPINLFHVTVSSFFLLVLASTGTKAEPWQQHDFWVDIPSYQASLKAVGSDGVDVDLLVYDESNNNTFKVDTPSNEVEFGVGLSGDYYIEVYCNGNPCSVPVYHSWTH